MQPEVLILTSPPRAGPAGSGYHTGQIREYQQENGTTVVLVSHSMEDIAKTAKKVLVMKRGAVAMYGETAEGFRAPGNLRQSDLRFPRLPGYSCSYARGFEVGENAYTVKQAFERLLPLLRKGGAGGA